MSGEELSPAERFAAARERAAATTGAVGEFAAGLSFELDPFQVQACAAVEAGKAVLVAAPTGAGKTVVGEFAIHQAMAQGRKAFYTTPIKALSNQKYHDLVERYGVENAGLLTGDTSLNGEAPVVVMTTEVLRNMLYADSPTLAGLRYVVMDEVHYLADRFRGPVWEEVIIHLPADVLVISLSATVSNAEEFGDWLATVRGGCEVVVSEHRPVPLFQHVMVGRRLVDLFADTGPDQEHAQVNPELVRLSQDDARRVRVAGHHRTRAGVRSRVAEDPSRRGGRRRGGNGKGGKGGRGGDDRGRSGGNGHSQSSFGHRGGSSAWEPPGRRGGSGSEIDDGPRTPGTLGGESTHRPSRAEVVARLDAEGLLPAITFIFSRAGCDAAVRQCLAAGVRLTTTDERRRIRAVAEAGIAEITHADLAVLGVDAWMEGLERGIAAHHAGLVPAFKVVVEDLFAAGLVKAVFATETLALGINMPARSVVLEKLIKFNGESHVQITPGEFTQLTGRAGRRGIDVEGHAVVVWNPGMDPEVVAGLASTRTYPLRSSFRPTYNMSVNLVAQVGRDAAREILETSFAQFQADRGVVDLARQVRDMDEALAGYDRAAACHLGDFSEYHGLRRRLSAVEKEDGRQAARARKAATLASLERLNRGDIVRVPTGKRSGFALVVDPGKAATLDGPRPTVLTLDAQVRRLTAAEVDAPLEFVTRMRIPATADPRRPKSRRDLASSMRNALAEGRRDRPDPVSADDSGRNDAPRNGGAGMGTDVTRLRAQLRAHPCHGCAEREDHDRWANRADDLRRRRDKMARQIQGRTSSIAAAFDKVCDLLGELGYLEGSRSNPTVTPAGAMLRRIYSEKDLLVAQCLREGAWTGLDPAALAAVAAAVVYEARREETGPTPHLPHAGVRDAVDHTVRLWSLITDAEEAHGVKVTPRLDLGLVAPMYGWAHGGRLELVLEDADLTAGDFVRWSRQAIDLLSQVALASQRAVQEADPRDADERALRAVEDAEAMAQTARAAVGLIERGVVAVDLAR